MQRGALDEAERDFQRAATMRPNGPAPLSNQAILMLRRDELDEAEVLIERAGALDANDFVVPQARGIARLMRNRPVQAVAALPLARGWSRATSTPWPGRPRPMNSWRLRRRAGGLCHDPRARADKCGHAYSKARILVWRGDRDHARAAIDAFAPADGDDMSRLIERALMLRDLGQGEAATQAFARALTRADAVQPPQGLPANQIATGRALIRQGVLAASGDMPGAIREIGTAIRNRPTDASLLNLRCWTRATGNVELEQALTDCDRALTLSPNNAAFLDSRALVKLRLGRTDDAIADATAALAVQPMLAASLFVRGIAYMRKGDRASADRDLAAARRLTFDIDLRYRRYGVSP